MNKKKIVLLISVAVVLVIIFSLLFSINSREKTYPYHEQLRDIVVFKIIYFDIQNQCNYDFSKAMSVSNNEEVISYLIRAEKSCMKAYHDYEKMEIPKSFSSEDRKLLKKDINNEKAIRKIMSSTAKELKTIVESNYNYSIKTIAALLKIVISKIIYSPYIYKGNQAAHFIPIYFRFISEPYNPEFIQETPLDSYIVFLKECFFIRNNCLVEITKTEKLLDENNRTEALKTAQKAEQSCLKASQKFAKLNADDKIPEGERKLLKKASDRLSGIYHLKYEYTKDLQTAAKTNSKDFRKKNKTKLTKERPPKPDGTYDIIDEVGKRLILRDEKYKLKHPSNRF